MAAGDFEWWIKRLASGLNLDWHAELELELELEEELKKTLADRLAKVPRGRIKFATEDVK